MSKIRTVTPGRWTCDFNTFGTIEKVIYSDTFRQMLGYESTEEYPDTIESWYKSIHPDDFLQFSEEIKQISETEGRTPFNMEYRMMTKNGYRWFHDYALIERNQSSGLLRACGITIDIHDSKCETEKALNELSIDNEIIASISKLYFSIFWIDLDRDYYKEISCNSTVQKFTGNEGKAQEKLNELCGSFVMPEYRNTVLDFLNLETLADRLSDSDTIFLEYHAMDGNWHKARFIANKRDSYGRITQVLFVTRLFSKEKQLQLEKEREHLEALNLDLKEQISVIGGLANAYFLVYKGNLDTGSFLPVKDIPFIRELTRITPNIRTAFETSLPMVVAPDDIEKMRLFVEPDTLRERLEKNDRIETEFHGTLPGLEWCRASWIVSERDERGAAVRVLFAVEEIGAAKKAQFEQERERNALLQLEKARLDTLTEAIHGGFKISRNDKKFTFIMVSDQLARLLGYETPEELMEASGGTMAGVVNLEDAAREIPGALKDVNAGKMYTMHYRMRCKDGTWMNVEDRGRLIRDTAGKDDEYWSFIVDQDELEQKKQALEAAKLANEELIIAQKELKKARDAAEAANNRTSQILGIINGLSHEYFIIWLVDKETRKMKLIRNKDTDISKMAVDLEDADSVFGQGIDYYMETFVEPEDRERYRQGFDFNAIVNRVENEKTYSMNYLGRNSKGTVGYHQVTFANADSSGGRYFVFAFRNIDKIVKEEQNLKRELKQAKAAAEEANRAKTAFLLNMSHDIRTPMNAILGYSQLMKKGLSDPEMLHYQEKIEQAGAFLLSLINNVLDMARIESGQMTLDEDYNETGDIISGIVNVFEESAKKKNIRIEYLRDIEHKNIICDKLKVQEIFTNLISNAIKYTTDGGSVFISTKEKSFCEAGFVTIETVVEDTGIGMSSEFLPHVFDSFTREKNTTAGKIAGTGLGMSIVKKYVELMGGTINAESELGKGSRFTVTLKHKVADNAQLFKEKAARAYAETDIAKLSGGHILLAEDNELNAEIAITILEDYGFIVDHAEDGVECVEKMEHNPLGTYDLILMDIQMPNMDGYLAAQIIRSLPDPEKSSIPIIAMTANVFEDDRQNALKAGMNGYLTKPVEISKLIETLVSILKEYS